jgi:hypothetical protein
MKTAARVLLLVLVAAIGVIGQRYYYWVAQAESPFDEVGIGIHQYMPGPIQSWGCGRLKARFGGRTLPPYGCGDPNNPRLWRGA